MNRASKFTLILVFYHLTACAPVVYESAYLEHHAPAHHLRPDTVVNVNTASRHVYPSIEVTLYADHTYIGLGFNPIHIVFHDGDYVEVSIRSKKGHYKPAFAHYHRGALHFDRDRNCNRHKDARVFTHGKGWKKGQRYNNAIAGLGNEYKGVNIEIREALTQEEIKVKKESRSGYRRKTPIVQRTMLRTGTVSKKYVNKDQEKTVGHQRRDKGYVAGGKIGGHHKGSKNAGLKKAQTVIYRPPGKAKRLKEGSVAIVNEKKHLNAENFRVIRSKSLKKFNKPDQGIKDSQNTGRVKRGKAVIGVENYKHSEKDLKMDGVKTMTMDKSFKKVR